MITITTMLPQHWEAVKTIYEEGTTTGNATFQTVAPGWQEWDNAHIKTYRIIAIENSEALGSYETWRCRTNSLWSMSENII